MRRGVSRDQDMAMFDQLQAEAINALRRNIVWFVLAVDQKMGSSLMISCPERIESDEIDAVTLYRAMLSLVIATATDALVTSLEEEE